MAGVGVGAGGGGCPPAASGLVSGPGPPECRPDEGTQRRAQHDRGQDGREAPKPGRRPGLDPLLGAPVRGGVAEARILG